MTTTLRTISTERAPKAIGPYSQAISVGDFIFCAGQGAIDPASGENVKGDIRVETERTLDNLAAVLAAAGSDLGHVVKSTVFLVDSVDLPPIEDPDEFYDHQLEGLRVVTTTGTPVGSVAEVLHTAAGELLSVRSEEGEVLVPFVSAIVTSVSLADQTIEIDPPEGLLELD